MTEYLVKLKYSDQMRGKMVTNKSKIVVGDKNRPDNSESFSQRNLRRSRFPDPADLVSIARWVNEHLQLS